MDENYLGLVRPDVESKSPARDQRGQFIFSQFGSTRTKINEIKSDSISTRNVSFF